jgi:DNA-binding MarR family transcriptional regulator
MVTQTIPAAKIGSNEAESADLVDQILDQLEPIIARQRKSVARHGCLRAISSTHLHVLFLLTGDGQMTMSRLAEQLGASLPNVTGIVDRMEERGFVERGRDPEDRRVVTVVATDAGREAVDEIDQVRRRSIATILAQLTPEQQQRALRTFTEMRAAAEQLTDIDPQMHTHTHAAFGTATN